MLLDVVTASTAESKVESAVEGEAEYSSYEDIYNAYSQKIKNAVPRLIKEYKTEAENNEAEVEGIAETSNVKITKLAEISTEGTEKMAELALTTGAGSTGEEYK